MRPMEFLFTPLQSGASRLSAGTRKKFHRIRAQASYGKIRDGIPKLT